MRQRVLKDLQIKYILVAENMLIFTEALREKYVIYAIINVLKRFMAAAAGRHCPGPGASCRVSAAPPVGRRQMAGRRRSRIVRLVDCAGVKLAAAAPGTGV